jgi:hypothetical protein
MGRMMVVFVVVAKDCYLVVMVMMAMVMVMTTCPS